jgi:hypothetical protein
MRSPEEVATVLELNAAGLNACEIARRTAVPRSTVRGWVVGAVPRHSATNAGNARHCGDCGVAHHRSDELPTSYVYLLGMYLGDGCISAHPRDVYRLRICLDLRYPNIVDECEAAIREIVPGNRVGRLPRTSNYVPSSTPSHVEVSAYSKAWPCHFPQHGPGRKHERPIHLTGWQQRLVEQRPELLLRGLIHSDGCRFINTSRAWRNPRYSFANLSADIRGIFCHACDLLDLHHTAAPRTVYVSRRADVARMDEFIGPKS